VPQGFVAWCGGVVMKSASTSRRFFVSSWMMRILVLRQQGMKDER